MAGSVAKRPNGKWRAVYRDETGRQHSRHFATKKAGRDWLDEITASIKTGIYADPRNGKVTFRAYAEQWRAAQVHRPTTQAQAETHLRRHVYPTFGDRPIGSVRRNEVQAWVTQVSKTLAPSTVRTVYSYLAAVFRAAVDNRDIAKTPCDRISLPKANPARVEPLPVEVVEALTAAVSERYRALITLGVGTGLRQGEAFAVTMDKVDFLRKTLTVDRQLVLMPGAAPYLAPPKTAASNRTIPLPTVVVDALAAHLAAFPATEQDIEWRDGNSPPKTVRVALVFTVPSGAPIRRTHFSGRVWGPARTAVRDAAAKAQAEAKRRGSDEAVPIMPANATFHDLRHFYASLLIRHGESVKTVQTRMGHAQASETLDTYSHLWPDSDDMTRTAVDSVLGQTSAARSVDRLWTGTAE